jgi:hypothetical protein
MDISRQGKFVLADDSDNLLDVPMMFRRDVCHLAGTGSHVRIMDEQADKIFFGSGQRPALYCGYLGSFRLFFLDARYQGFYSKFHN